MAAPVPPEDPGAAPGPAQAVVEPPAARHRLNLIELITADAVTSDYADPQPAPAAPSRGQQALVVAIALGVVGFVLALGFSARILNAPAVDSQRVALAERIAAEQREQAALAREVAVLREEVVTARAAELDRVAGGAQVAAEVAALELATGYVAVRGPGAVVELTDARAGAQGAPSDVERVLDTDVQRAVNGLWAAGAEAIAVNDQRVSTRTAIRSAAGAILVNYRPLRPPYRVAAIGPPGMLAAFEAGADAAYLAGVASQYGIGFTSEPAQELLLPASTSPLPEQATVIEPDEDAQGDQG